VILLKLLLVPLVLLLISLAGKRWGPAVAGWLAGFPVVAGPILLFLAIDSGAEFAAHAAVTSLSAIFALAIFGATYARCCQRMSWLLSAITALVAWFIAATILIFTVHSIAIACIVAASTLVLVPVVFPNVQVSAQRLSLPKSELGFRMLAGALLMGAVTTFANRIGPDWSGVLSMFPVMAMVLAVFLQRANGAQHAAALLRAMSFGLWSFVAFCLTLATMLPLTGIVPAFLLALLFALGSHAIVRMQIMKSS
jgi:uncharacterized membrane protein (GlpM family)